MEDCSIACNSSSWLSGHGLCIIVDMYHAMKYIEGI